MMLFSRQLTVGDPSPSFFIESIKAVIIKYDVHFNE